MLPPPSRPWTPRRLPGLLLWASADFGLTAGILAAQMTATNTESLQVADDAALSGADADWFTAGWFWMDSSGGNRGMWGKYGSGNQLEWLLFMATNDRVRFFNSGNGSASVSADDQVTLAINAWHLAVAWHDSVANTINLRVDNGIVRSTAHTTGTFNGTALFEMGRFSQSATQLWNGRQAQVMYAKTPTPIGALIAAIQSRLWNGGAGIRHLDLSVQEKTDWGLTNGVGSLWPLEEASGNRADVISGKTATDINTVTNAAAKAQTLFNADPVAQVRDRSRFGNNLSSVVASRPTYRTALFGAKPGLRFSSSLLTLTAPLVLAGDFTISVAVAVKGGFGAYFGHSSGTGKVVQTDAAHLTLTNDANASLALTHGAIDVGLHEVTLVRSGTTVTRYLDGVADGTGTLAGTITLDQVGRVGGATAPLDADLADIVAYDRAYAA